LILITVAGYVVTLWSERRWPERTAYDIPIALWLVAGALGVVAAPDHLKALGTYRAYFVEAVACFYVAVGILHTRDDLRKLFGLAAISAAAMSVGGIILFIEVAARHQLQLGDAPSFLYLSPNANAMYLEPPLAYALGMVAFPWSRRERLIAAGVAGLVLIEMILTLSRAGYLAMLVLAFALVLYLPSRRLRIWVLAVVAVAVLLVLEVPFINQRVSDVAHSAQLRNSIYSQAIEVLVQRPIFGAGIDGFALRVAPFRPAAQEVEIYPHNVFLTTWSEVGLLGVVVFAFILFSLLWRGLRALPSTNDVMRPVLWGSVGALSLILVHGLFDSPYWKNDLSAEFWLVAALLLVAIRGGQRGAAP
jgi:O-antigen ligase